jgi:hypothetical protein
VSAAANRFPNDSAFNPRKKNRDADKRKEADMLRIITIARELFLFLIRCLAEPYGIFPQQL